jgi:CheY-like chemotaxis protein
MQEIAIKDLVFALNKPIAFEESMTCEFKEVKNDSPLHAIGKKVDEYVVAFLNVTPGSIFWGIRNDRTVAGVHMNHKMRDELRQVVGQKIGAIAPPVSAECYELPFHQVFQSGAEGEFPLYNTFVVEVRVRSTGGSLYLTGSGECYRKTLGGVKKLTGSELLSAIEKALAAKRKTPTGLQRSAGELDLESMPSVEHRASVVTPLLQGARVLWVDDNPINNLYERTFLASLGIPVDLAVSTEEALYMAARLRYNLILSDMKRGTCPTAGIELLRELTSQGSRTPLVFYVGHADKGRLPTGAFAVTDSPDELMHYIFDVLERRPPSLPKGPDSGA